MTQWRFIPASDYAQISSQWQHLNQRTANSQLLHPSFVQPLLNHFGHDPLLIAIGTDSNDQWIAATIIEKLGWGRWQTFQPSQAPISCWLCLPELFNETLIQSLASALPGIVLTLGITQLDPAMLPRPVDTATCNTLDYITTGRLTVPDDFEAYWQSRSKNVRQNTAKAKQRLLKEGVTIRFDAISNPKLIARCVAEYGQIESGGWKSKAGTAIHPDNNQGRFYTDMLKNFAPDNIELWRYFYDGAVVATDLCIHDGKTLIILKTTYDEAWKRNSPAFCLHVDGIRHCVNQGYQSIEFFGPAMEWHKKLTNELRNQYHVNWYALAAISRLKPLVRRLNTQLAIQP